MMRDLLVVERNEANQQRTQLKGVHDSIYASMKRILKFNEKMHRRAVKRNKSEMKAMEDDEEAFGDTESKLNETRQSRQKPLDATQFANNMTEIIDTIEGSSLHQNKISHEQQQREMQIIKDIER